MRDAVHPEDRALFEAKVRAAMADPEGRYQSEFRLLGVDGSIAWLFERRRIERDAEGHPLRLLGLSQDITERKPAGQGLREADRRKDEFFATLAHELRNPLAPIRNAVEILKLKDSGDATLRAVRDVIDRQLQNMVRLVDDLLDVSRISRGKLELRSAPVTLGAVIEQAIETSRPHVEAGEHRLTVTLPPEPIWLVAGPEVR